MSSPITPSFRAFYKNPACAVGEESWEEGREKMTGDFVPSKNSWNHDIWRLMLACFFYDTFIFCSFPYKPSFFCPPCWQLRRSAHLHFYLSACCSMFRTPSSLALLLFPIKKKVLQVILQLWMRERLQKTWCYDVPKVSTRISKPKWI